jgi:hypothetical protein
MTKKKQKKKRISFVNFIEKTIGEIRSAANFKDYKINFRFAKKDKELEDGGGLTVADIHVDTRYLSAYITVFPCLKKIYNNSDYDEIRSVICHEMAHIRTQKLYDCAVNRNISERELKNSWETLTEEYGRLIYDKMSK